jgi:hypothetical protein
MLGHTQLEHPPFTPLKNSISTDGGTKSDAGRITMVGRGYALRFRGKLKVLRPIVRRRLQPTLLRVIERWQYSPSKR